MLSWCTEEVRCCFSWCRQWWPLCSLPLTMILTTLSVTVPLEKAKNVVIFQYIEKNCRAIGFFLIAIGKRGQGSCGTGQEGGARPQTWAPLGDKASGHSAVTPHRRGREEWWCPFLGLRRAPGWWYQHKRSGCEMLFCGRDSP